jgi:hypothetical protein
MSIIIAAAALCVGQDMHELPFTEKPDVVAVASGRWSDRATWSSRVPTARDHVRIDDGFQVVIDDESPQAADVLVAGCLAFREDRNTRLIVDTLYIDKHGCMDIGTELGPVTRSAELVIRDTPVRDKEQISIGFVCEGRCRMNGIAKTSFVRLARDAKAGERQLALSEPVSGWTTGDKLVLPDSGIPTQMRFPAIEEAEVSSVSADGKLVELKKPLRYNHFGVRDQAGKVRFLPHVSNCTRNVVVRSANPLGTRGHVMFMHRADVEVRNVLFQELGRTTVQPLSPESNPIGRYACHLHRLYGPRESGRKYQFVIEGCVVSGSPKAGFVIHDSHFGLVQNNVAVQCQGACFVTEDGNETGNVIAHNIGIGSVGSGEAPGDRKGEKDFFHEGSTMWFGSAFNTIQGNVAVNGSRTGITAWEAVRTEVTRARFPLFAGADPKNPEESSTVPQRPIEWSDNEIYASVNGMFINGERFAAGPTAIWNIQQKGASANYGSRLGVSLTGFTILNGGAKSWGIEIQGVDSEIIATEVQGFRMGMRLIPKESARISECTLSNQSNIVIMHDASDKLERLSLIDRCVFSGGAADIELKGEGVIKDEILVTSYNGKPGDDFQLYYLSQAPSYIVPHDMPGKLYGAPAAGLTNREAWDRFGVAVAGAVSPTGARRGRITGFVQPLPPGRAESMYQESLANRQQRQETEGSKPQKPEKNPPKDDKLPAMKPAQPEKYPPKGDKLPATKSEKPLKRIAK